MVIHYQNSEGKEIFLRNVIHLQNVNNYTFLALFEDGTESTLYVSRIEGICADEVLNQGKSS